MNDLRDFIRALEKRGELRTVDHPVDPLLEIAEVADRVVKAEGPALLFRHPTGFSIPVLVNQFGSHERMLLALRSSSYEELGERVKRLMDLSMPQGLLAKVKTLGRLRDLASYAPKVVKEGACQDIVLRGDEVDLTGLPVLQCWPEDGGRFVTLPVVFTRDPHRGVRNAGMYRLQLFDRNTTGMHWHVHKDAAQAFRSSAGRLEAAVAIGTDPAITYAATAPLPGMVDEMLFAGFLRDAPVEMTRCVSVDVEVPAHAEIVLEGYVEPGELRREGPFGDHTGYYSLADDYPVFHVTSLTHRRDPIYSTTIVGKPPMEDAYLGKATERLFLPLLRLTLPEVVDMDLPAEGVFHNCAILSLRKAYPMHARKLMHAVWGMGQMQFTKFVIVVDEAVDVHDYGEVAWRVASNVDPERDVILTNGPLDALDHSAPRLHWGAKMGIDATTKWPEEDHPRPWPPDIVMSSDVVERVDRMWDRLGLGPLLPSPTGTGAGASGPRRRAG